MEIANSTKEDKGGRPKSTRRGDHELEGLDEGQTEAALARKRGYVPKGIDDGLRTVPKRCIL